MRTRSVVRALLAVCGMSLALPAAAQDLPSAEFKVVGPQKETLTWKANISPFFNEELPELSKQRIKPSLVSMTDLGLKGPEVFRMIKIGIADLGATGTSYAAGEIPELDGLDLAGLIQDVPTLRKVIDTYTPVLNEVMAKRAGVKPLAIWPTVAQVMWCAKPIGGLADLKGKKVRTLGTTQADFVRSVGAEPITMSPAEVVTSIQRGVIDCAITGSESGYRAKWPEVTTHLYPINLGWSLWILVANERSWAKMDPKVQEFLLQKLNDVMIKRAWKIAEEGTEQGIWCSVGDKRCELSKKNNTPIYNLKLVAYSDADDAARKEAVSKVVLPAFAKRCGEACTANWNKSVGKVLGVEAKP